MRTSKKGGCILGLALACNFQSLATGTPLPAITTLSAFGTFPAQTVTASSQTVTYSELITRTTTAAYLSAAGTWTKGCLTTVVPSAGTYTLESPQEIVLISPYFEYNFLNTCPTCDKEVINRECQFGQCDAYLLSLIYVNPTSTITSVLSASYGSGCTPSLPGGSGGSPATPTPTSTPTVTLPPDTLPVITINPTGILTTTIGTNIVVINGCAPSITPTPPITLTPPPTTLPILTVTSYFTGSGGEFSTTVGNTCVVYIPYATVTIPIPAASSAFTIFNSGTEVIGSPSPTPSASSVPIVYVTTTLYFNGAGNTYTTTIGSSVFINLPYTRTTVTLPPGAAGYTATVSGEIICATPAPYPTSTTYIVGGLGFTSTISGSDIVVGIPATITTLSLPATASPFTSTISGGQVIVVGSPGPYVYNTIYTTGVGATTTNGGTIIAEIPYVTSRICSGVNAPSVSTSGATIYVFSQQPTATVTATVPAGSQGYSSLRSAVDCSATATLFVFTPSTYALSTTYLDHGEPPFTQTSGGTIIVGIPAGTATVTTTLFAYQTAYTSTIFASGSVSGTVVVGSPGPYHTTTSYLDNGGSGYTSTIGGSVIIGISVPTVTLQATISAGLQGYTTTIPGVGSIPGTVIIETPAPYVYYTSFIPNTNGGGVTTVTAGGSIVVYIPYTTVLSYFNPSSGSGNVATTITGKSGTVTCVTPYAFTTSYVASAGSAAQTSTGSGTIYYITEFVTATSYIYGGGSSYLSTIGGTIVYGIPTLPPIPLPTVTIEVYGSIAGTQTVAASGTIAASVIITVPSATACANAGVSLGVYNMSPVLSDSDSTFSAFDPTVYKKQVPFNQTTAISPTYNCPGSGTALCTLTGVTTPLSFAPANKVIDFHGYFIAPFSGTYTFSTSHVDDALFIWFSAFAVSGWTRANANLIATYGTYPLFPEQSQSLAVTLTAGKYYPLRILHVNAQGGGGFTLNIVGPGGPVLFDATNLVRSSCDGSVPPFPLFGLET